MDLKLSPKQLLALQKKQKKGSEGAGDKSEVIDNQSVASQSSPFDTYRRYITDCVNNLILTFNKFDRSFDAIKRS
jgi:hypothetical protein